MPDGENMKRHHSNGRTLAVEGHTPGGGGRLPPIGGRHSHPPRGGWASTRGVQRPISLQVLTKVSGAPFTEPPMCTAGWDLGYDTCGNHSAPQKSV